MAALFKHRPGIKCTCEILNNSSRPQRCHTLEIINTTTCDAFYLIQITTRCSNKARYISVNVFSCIEGSNLFDHILGGFKDIFIFYYVKLCFFGSTKWRLTMIHTDPSPKINCNVRWLNMIKKTLKLYSPGSQTLMC